MSILRKHRGLSPVIASMILVSVGLVLGGSLSFFVKETAFSDVRVEVVEISYTYCSTNTQVTNAKWKLVLNMINRGTHSVQIHNVFINSKEVDIYGLSAGETLSDGDAIGTNIPEGGLNLNTGEEKEIYVWIGESLFSSGTVLEIQFNDINKATQARTIKLS